MVSVPFKLRIITPVAVIKGLSHDRQWISINSSGVLVKAKIVQFNDL